MRDFNEGEGHGDNSPCGLVLEIQRLSTEDGPGIRTTVFFKGCPLNCTWCHNPESISPRRQLSWFETRCIGCRSCMDTCRNHALSGSPSGIVIDRGKCISCGECESCQHGHPNLCPDVRFCGTPPIDGVFAEYTIMPAENCFPLPEGFAPDDGAMLEPLGVAIHAVDLAHLRPGQTVAVLGAGPIGLLTAAVAKAAGAGEIYMTEPLAHRRQFALDNAARRARRWNPR